MRRLPFATRVFAAVGAASLGTGVTLLALGSFAYLAALSIGLLFIAAALASSALGRPEYRMAGVLFVLGIALLTFGLVATPVYFLGWLVIGVAAALTVAGSFPRTRS